MLNWTRRDLTSAAPLSEQAVTIGERNLDLAAAAQAERQQMAMTRQFRSSLDSYLSLVPLVRIPAGRAYGHVLIDKGAVLERQRHLGSLRRRAREEPDSETARLFAGLLETSTRSGHTRPGHARPGASRRLAGAGGRAVRRKEEIETKLAQQDGTFRAAQAEARRRPEDLQAALPPDTSLIDFLEYTHATPPAGGKGKITEGERPPPARLRGPS